MSLFNLNRGGTMKVLGKQGVSKLSNGSSDNRVLFFDRWEGRQQSDRWDFIQGNGATDAVTEINHKKKGGMVLSSGKMGQKKGTLKLQMHEVNITQKPRLKMKITMKDTTNVMFCFGFYQGDSNCIDFYYDAAGEANNWMTRTKKKGVTTINDTGILATSSTNEYEIIVDSGQVQFAIDGIVCATHNANLPSATLNAFVTVKANSNKNSKELVDFICLSYLRP